VLEWERIRSLPTSFLHPIHSLCKVWKTRPRCIACPLKPLVPCTSGRSFHTKQPLSTGPFSLPLQVVGNRERHTPSQVLFSKCPHFHSPDLENSPTYQILSCQSHRLYFHFSCRTTGTAVFDLSLSSPFPLTVASLRTGRLDRKSPSSCLHRRRLLRLARQRPRIQTTPLFSTHAAMLR
jgi:hypothetical protein